MYHSNINLLNHNILFLISHACLKNVCKTLHNIIPKIIILITCAILHDVIIIIIIYYKIYSSNVIFIFIKTYVLMLNLCFKYYSDR